MTGGAWRYAVASAIGSSHRRTGGVCQDRGTCHVLTGADQQAVLVAVAADGAGSAARAEVGAELACRLVRDRVAALLGAGGGAGDIAEGTARAWLADLRSAVAARAAADGMAPRAYACTLLAAVIGDSRAVFLQVGDGAMVARAAGDNGGGHRCLFWPDHGEYANTTAFATGPEAAAHLRFAALSQRIEEVALFTDGLERLALDFAGRCAHEPFFSGMFAPVRTAAAGPARRLSADLDRFLASQRMDARTDDDRTLILATRWRSAARRMEEAAGEPGDAQGLRV
jgi:hypothetical protein